MGEMRGIGWIRQGFEAGAQGDHGDGSVYMPGKGSGSGALPSLISQQSHSALIYFI